MSRRVSRIAVIVLSLSLMLSSTSAFAAMPNRDTDGSVGPFERIVRVVRDAIKHFAPNMHSEDASSLPTPPKP